VVGTEDAGRLGAYCWLKLIDALMQREASTSCQDLQAAGQRCSRSAGMLNNSLMTNRQMNTRTHYMCIFLT
jgi:hypothetical protein